MEIEGEGRKEERKKGGEAKVQKERKKYKKEKGVKGKKKKVTCVVMTFGENLKI